MLQQLYSDHVFCLFFIGSQLVSTIYVAEFNGSNQKTVHTVSDDIRSIAVDPVGGYVDVLLIFVPFTVRRRKCRKLHVVNCNKQSLASIILV